MKNIYCSLFGHQYEVSKKVTYHVKEYKCSHCSSQMTTNGKGGLTPLTPKYQEINSVLERIHFNRLAKKGIKQSQPYLTRSNETVISFRPQFS